MNALRHLSLASRDVQVLAFRLRILSLVGVCLLVALFAGAVWSAIKYDATCGVLIALACLLMLASPYALLFVVVTVDTTPASFESAKTLIPVASAVHGDDLAMRLLACSAALVAGALYVAAAQIADVTARAVCLSLGTLAALLVCAPVVGAIAARLAAR